MRALKLVSLAAVVGGLSGCFVTVPEGASCTTNADCPEGQVCVAAVCRRGDASGGGTAGGTSGGGSAGGQSAGGAAGGGSAGGSAGGATAGGSAGGVTAGGSAGGATAGGSAGGATAGGSAGGATAGGSAGGAAAGGSAGGAAGGAAAGGSAGGSAGGTADTEAPVVVQTTPVTGSTMVSRATTIQFVFSEPMNTASVLYLFSPTITFNTPVWSNGNTTLTLTPTASLAFNTMYSVTFTGQDVAGNPMSPPYSYSFTTEAMPDGTAPTIISSLPADGATDVPTTTSVLITFSEPMDRSSVSLSMNPTVTFSAPTWASNDTELSVSISAPLAASTQHRLQVTGRDLAGNLLAAPSIAFTTAMPPDNTPPTLTNSVPMNNATAVPVTTRLSFSFSEPINPASLVVEATPDPGLSVQGWMGGTSVALTQTNDWPPSTNVVVTVDARDLAGNPMATANLTFTTAAPPDMTRPTVASTVPDAMATGVPRSANIEFNFSEPMNRAATEAAFSSSPAITCVFTWNTAGTLMSCNPTVDLNGSAGYTITLGTGARDLVGNTLATAYTFAFTTAAAPDMTRPTITSTNPSNNAVGVPRSSGLIFNQTPTPIRVTFSEAMSQASVQGSFSITSPSGFNGGTFSWDRNTMTYIPPAYFAYGQQVTFQIGTGATDLAGNNLAATYSSTFRVRRRATANFTNAASSAALDGYITGTATCSTATFSAGSSVAPAGDSSSNQIYRGYLTFSLSSLSSLANVTIASATLYTQQVTCYGNPFVSTFGSTIEAWHVDYGPSLDLGDCGTANLGSRQYTLSTSSTVGQRSVGVSAAVQDDWTNRVARGYRSQFQLRTATLATNNNSASDYCSQATYNGSTANRPYLTITYEYD